MSGFSFKEYKLWDGTKFYRQMTASEVFTERIIGWIFGLVLALAIIGAVALLAPLICLIFYFTSEVKKHRVQNNIASIIVGVYLFFDYQNGWISYLVADMFFNPWEILNVYAVDMAIVLAHVVLLLFEEKIYNIVAGETGKAKVRNMMLYIIALIFVMHFATKFIMQNMISQYQPPIENPIQ